MSTWIDDLLSKRAKNSIAFAGELEFAGASEDDRTGRTVQFRIVRKPEDMLVAHPFSKYTRRRRGHAGTRFESVFNEIDGDQQVQCEVMLLNWADGPGGATVKFLLDHALDDHPFLGATRRTKEKAGTGYMVVLLELDDDNEIIDQVKRERVERASQKLSNVAAMMVKHPRFHEWLREVERDTRWTAESADQWLKAELEVESKSELDHELNVRAITIFSKIRSVYIDWLEANGYDREE